MLLSEDSIEDQTEHVRSIRKTRAVQTKPLVACLRTLDTMRKCVKASADQGILFVAELELTRVVRNACPELWRNSLKRSNLKLVGVSVEQLVRHVEGFDGAPRAPDPKPFHNNLHSPRAPVELRTKMKQELRCFANFMAMATMTPMTVTTKNANESRR